MRRRTLLLAAPVMALPLPAAGQGGDTRLTFEARFTTLPLWHRGPIPRIARALGDPGFAWFAGGLHAVQAAGSPASWATLANNHEAQAYPNADAIDAGAGNPFSVVAGALAITARPMIPAEAALRPPGLATPYLSGALSTYPFGQTYGTFEIEAQLPAGRGLWPAFWLLPVDDTWPPEIDVMEVLGHSPGTLYTSLHTRDPSQPRDQTTAHAVADTSADFHRYTVTWGPNTVSFAFDGRVLATRPTPADMHKAFYLVINLAVGGTGSWPGAPDAATVFPAVMRVRAVRVWA